MRTDYALYAVALICFIIAVYAAVSVEELYVYTLAVVGIVFVGLGYMARPKTIAASTAPHPSPPATLPEIEAAPKTEIDEEPKKEPVKRAARRTTRRRKRT
ncbi:MAG: hypothetical protein WCC63_01145 [Candidatus Bathyarchaeia archaeon]